MKQHTFAIALMATTMLGAAGAAMAETPTATAPAVPAAQTVSFSVYLPLRNTAAMKQLLIDQQTVGSPSYHQWLTPAQVAAQFGPTADTMAQAEAALTAAGLSVDAVHLRSIDVSGPASAVSKTLGIALKTVATDNGGTRVITTGRVAVPAALAGALIPSFAAVPDHKLSGGSIGDVPDNRSGPVGAYMYNDLKQAYDYPSYASLDGTGAKVAIVMEDLARTTDVTAMFTHEHFQTTTGKNPTFTTVKIHGGGSLSGGGVDEASLDTQMVIGGAPGSNVVLFSTPSLSDNDLLAAYTAIVDDGSYDLVTSSFGGCELFYTPNFNNGVDFTFILSEYSELFELGNLEGTTFFASSGDEGGLLCPTANVVPHFIAKVTGPAVTWVKGTSNPSGDPNVTSVGGGNLVTNFTSGSLDSTYVSENGSGDPETPYDAFGIGVNISGGYWGAGGGLSAVYAKPAYQNLVNTGSSTARTQPDVGMMVGGCPGGISVLPCGPNRSAVVVTVNGRRIGLIGTSVSSPEFAGAVALAVQANQQAFLAANPGASASDVVAAGRFGNLNPYLYAKGAAQTAAGGPNAPAASQFYHTGQVGFDGAYSSTAAGGYNYIFGNGTPDVRNLFGLTALPAAGVPQTASNP
jgi:subtilase family serine protease